MRVEDYVPQAALFVSPPKWHLGHTTWFFEEFILKVRLKSYQEYDPQFSFLFNSYYNNIGERTLRHERGLITRPIVEEVYNYRKHVDQNMEALLGQNIEKDIEELILVGINHEQQHQELLITDFKFLLAQNPIHPIYDPLMSLVSIKNEPSNGFIHIDEGVYEIGYKEEGFSYDNEHGVHKVYLNEFNIAKDLVTNGEYLEFLESGAYQNFNLWLDEGWAWVNENDVKSPLYWKEIDGKWFIYTLAGLKPIDFSAPVSHISFYEANAFANWKGMRLPTEFEWEVASNQFNWGLRWEWTNSAYLPYPGFKIAAGALGEYNGKFMVNQMVLRGASVATSANHSRKTYRNFFHPQLQWQYSGLRLIKK
jgi:ergothioneine biosynthesis protein EgtB